MKNKINAGGHGLIDYGFALALATVPKMMKADEKTVMLYRTLALEVLLYGALTKQPYEIKGLISMPIHKKIDIVNLGTLGLLNFYSGIRKNRKVSIFNMGMVACGVLAVAFTNWERSKV